MLTPGITYDRQLWFTPHGPDVVHVMTVPRPGGLYALRPILSNNTVIGRETVTSMEKRYTSTATIGGVNGDLFTWDEGLPSGMFMQSGNLLDHLSVAENIRLQRYLAGKSSTNGALTSLASRLGLSTHWNALPAELSGGEALPCSAPGRGRASGGL